MVIKNPCVLCKKFIAKTHRALRCDICSGLVHIKCNNVTPSSYLRYMDNKNDPSITVKDNWYCISCINSQLPFGLLNNNQFYINSKGILSESTLENMNFSLSHADKKIVKQISNIIVENTDPTNAENFCKYYELDNFVKSSFIPESNLSILHLNIASLQFHFDSLLVLLNVLEFSFDCIAITETKININAHPTKDLNIPGYHFYSTPTEASKGGTLVYVSDILISKPRKDIEIYKPKDLESTFIEIVVPRGKNIIIGCIYKHHGIDINEFTELLTHTLDKTNKEKKICCIAGDFNINLLKLNENKQIEEYFDALTNNNFMPLITLPTRITSKTKTLIDNIIFNNFTPGIKSGNINVSISDHVPQFAIIPLSNKNFTHKKQEIFVRNFKDIDKPLLLNTLKAELLASTNTDVSDIDRDLSNLLESTDRTVQQLFPLKKVSKRQLKLKSKPWITNAILKAIQLRDKTYSKLKNSTDILRKEALQIDLRDKKSNVKTMLRASKKEYFTKYFTENSKNAKKLWEGINEIISNKPRHHNMIKCLETKDKNGNIITITDPKEIPNIANTYYTNIADKIIKKQKYPGSKHFTSYLKSPNQHIFDPAPTTPSEIESIIKDFDPSKSVGPNSLPPKLLNHIAPIVSKPISDICNKSIPQGTYPNGLKIANLIPIHKKDSKLDISNYRPISLLSNINKIIEKVMFNRLYAFLENHKCIYNLQFGFRKNHSTNHAILSIIEKIQDAIKNNKFAIGIFIDLQKAFDTVDHSILLNKLSHYGIRNNTNKWFESYLTNRQQFVSINGHTSDYSITKHGVPQGSVLGPLLFLIYINDMHACIKNSGVFHFADDTNLLYTPTHTNYLRKLNIDLKSLNHWLMANKISLNASKTELIIFRKPNTPLPNLKIKLNGVKLIPKSEVKYLGLILDEHLTFKPHIHILNAKLKRATNLLAISRHYLTPNLLKQIYYSQFHSHLSYGCQIWGSKPSSSAQTSILQNKAIRIMSFVDRYASAGPLYKKLEIIKLNDLITSHNILFVHKTLNGNSPAYFKNHFEEYKPTHTYNTTRNPTSTYSLPPGSVTVPNDVSFSFKSKCGQSWNDFLKKICTTTQQSERLKETNILKLKNIIKSHILGNYS